MSIYSIYYIQCIIYSIYTVHTVHCTVCIPYTLKCTNQVVLIDSELQRIFCSVNNYSLYYNSTQRISFVNIESVWSQSSHDPKWCVHDFVYKLYKICFKIKKKSLIFFLLSVFCNQNDDVTNHCDSHTRWTYHLSVSIHC